MNSQSENTLKRWNWPFLLALLHTLLLACYALPADLIPERARFWSTTYTRPLFHQDWSLFAPNVPPCGCTIEVLQESGYQDMMQGEGLIGRRLVKWGCRSMQNYRDPHRIDGNLMPWPGYTGYLQDWFMESDPIKTRIKRSCWNGSEREVFIDEVDQ